LFLGQYTCVLKNKNRLRLPPGFSGLLADEAYVTQGFDRNLFILTPSAFREVYKRVTSVSITDPLARLLLRLIIGTTSRVEVKEEGLILLPAQLVEFAALQRKVVLVGQGDYFEVWSPDFWNRQAVELGDVEANARRFSSLTIATR
jgi:MraZ protein